MGFDSPRVHSIALEVEPGVHVGGRLYSAGRDSPLILFFHGNGEIAADYDDIAPLYVQRDITLLVADYRGYGTSGGRPTATHLLADALRFFEARERLVEPCGLAPRAWYVMGRSLGSAPAIELALHARARLAGLIVESGFADTFGLLRRLGVRVRDVEEERDGLGNAAKLSAWRRPPSSSMARPTC